MRQPLKGQIPENEIETVQFFLQSADRGLQDVGQFLAKEWRIFGDNRQSVAGSSCHQKQGESNLADTIPFALLLRLPEVINATGEFKRGSNATIAEVVFGNRSHTGGSYNTTIQGIKSRLAEIAKNGFL